MSQPQPFSRAFSFTNFASANPTSPIPGNQVDLELNNAKATLDAVLTNLALVQRDDGGLKNASVGLDQLKAEVPVGFNAPVVWTTATAYAAGSSTVFNGSGFYRCLVAHTSGVFATDLAANKWQLIVNLAAVPLVNASQIAVTASGSLTTDAQTSLQALDSGKAATSHTHVASAISDSTAAGRALLTAADATAQNNLLGTTNLGFQSGDVKETACLTLQSGWYYCDGSNKNRVADVNLFNALTIQQSGVLTSGSRVVTGLSDTSNMSPGMPMSGIGVPAATRISSIDSSTQVTMNLAATASATTPLVFAPYGVGDGATTFGIPNRSYVAVGRDNASGSASNVLQISTTISTTNGSTTATVASATGLCVGMFVGTPTALIGTSITAIVGTTITLNTAATGTASGAAARFSSLLDAQTLGSVGGANSASLIQANLPSVNFAVAAGTFTGVTNTGTVVKASTSSAFQSAVGGGTGLAFIGGVPTVGDVTVAGTTSTTTAASGGTSAPIGTSPPRIVMNFVIKR